MMKPKMPLGKRIKRKVADMAGDVAQNKSRRKTARKMKDAMSYSSSGSSKKKTSDYKETREDRLKDKSKERKFKQKRISSADRNDLANRGVKVKSMTASVPTASAKRAKRTLNRIDSREQMMMGAKDAMKKASNRSDISSNRADSKAKDKYAKGMLKQGVDISLKKRGL